MSVKYSLSFFSTLCLISIFIHLAVIPFLVEGFSADLIHRDHRRLTSQEPSISHYEKLHNAFLRSFARRDSLKAQVMGSSKPARNALKVPQGQMKSSVTNSGGEYLMEVSVGTPPTTFMATVSTVNYLTWLPCEPCAQCKEQGTPMFDPSKSSSYTKLPCSSPLCIKTDGSDCDVTNSCTYVQSYSDGTSAFGALSTETFTFGTNSGQNISMPNVAFGCGHGGEYNRSLPGLVGLGRGKLSLLNQFGNIVNGKFSYCLVPFGRSTDVTSKISFGTSAVVSGKNTKSTPLFERAGDPFYYLNLEGVSVVQLGRGNGTTSNGTRNWTRFNTSTASNKTGNIIIESGMVLTYLPLQMANDLEAFLRKTISGTIVPDPEGLFNLCYKTGEGTEFPYIVAHFTGGADIVLPKYSTFLQLRDDYMCLTLLGNNELPIFGNLAQGDYHIGYDLVNGTVSFQQTDCSKVD